jgi:hypothetical protein
MTLLFTPEGQVNQWPTMAAVAVASIAVAFTSPFGTLTYSSKDVINLTLPVAGTFAALALPAAQLAQSSVSDFLSAAQTLLGTDQPLDAVRAYLSEQATQYRRDLGAARCAVYYSIASFFIAVAGMLGTFDDVTLFNNLSVKNLIAALSVTTLIVAICWLIPLVNSAFSFAKADELLSSLAGNKPAPKAAAAPNVQKPLEAPEPAATGPASGEARRP